MKSCEPLEAEFGVNLGTSPDQSMHHTSSVMRQVHISETPKYSLPEIERRWLVDLSKVDVNALGEPEAIEDRYIVGTRLRLRRMSSSRGCTYKFAKKYGKTGLVDQITNIYLCEAEYAMLVTLPSTTLAKNRYRLEEGVIDDFGEFAIYEVEFARIEEATAYVPPPFVLKELEADELTGAALAAKSSPAAPETLADD